jgi:adenylate cyclase
MTGRRHALALALVALIAIATGFAFKGAHWLNRTELASVDKRFSIRGTQAPSPDVVVVAIDPKSVAADGGKVPLDRRHDAKVIEQLNKAGAAVIAYDVPFPDLNPDKAADVALFNAVHATKKLVLGTLNVSEDGSTDIFGAGDALTQSGAIQSWTGIPEDMDGRLRRTEFSLNGVDSFAVAAVHAKLGSKALSTKAKSTWIDYPGPSGTFKTLSFADVEKGAFPAAAVRGKIVVVGPSDPRFKNIHATPTDARMPGAEIQAAAVATVLEGLPLHAASGWLDALAIVLLAALAPLLARRLNLVIALLAQVVAIALFLLVAQLAFNGGTILTVVAPLAAGLVSLVGTALVLLPIWGPIGDAIEKLGPPRVNQRTRRILATSLLGSALLVTAGTLALQAANSLERQELLTVNSRFSIRGSDGPPSNIVLVAIDQETFSRKPTPLWPFPRTQHARVIDNLIKAGAKVVAYDVQFTENSGNYDADLALVKAVRRANGKVVLATTEPRPDGSTDVFGGGSVLKYSKGVPAWSAYIPDSDGKIRHMQASSSRLASFDLVTAGIFTGHKIGMTHSPTWIDFGGPSGTVKTLSFVDVRLNKFKPADVRGKIVVVGGTANNLQDFHDTSYGILMPGPEIHVNGIRTALEGFPLRDAPNWLNILLVAVLGFLAPVAGLRLRVVPALLIGGAGLIALLVGSQLLFQHAGWVNHVIYPFVAGAAAMILTGAIHGLTTAFEREQARDAFARFVPEAVVDQVLADAEGVRLGGVRREGTVMFSDLRGFTSFSETLQPEQVIEALNRYLTEMSDAILNHGGTLVAYMGDGIMAVFGAPLQQDDHADRALDAAREMLERLDGWNQWLRDQELHDGFKMGIGLNSGPVMSGNVGSERRLEYTALGDTTNTAARLEGMTKGTPHQLYIADTTKQRLTREVDDLVQVGEADVRGRKAKVLLWSLREGGPAPAPAGEPERVEA